MIGSGGCTDASDSVGVLIRNCSVCVPGCTSLDVSLYMCPWNVSLECVSGMRLSGRVSLVCARGVLFSVPSQYSQE